MTAAPLPVCPGCLAPYKPAAKFCGACGRSRAGGDAASSLKIVITFYLAMLGASTVAMIYTRVTDDVVNAMWGATIAFAVLTLAFAWPRRELIVEPSRHLGFSLGGYALVVLASLPILALVAGYIHALKSLFGIHLPGDLAGLENTHVVWTILLIAILPPLQEELAFRGLIYGGLRKTLTIGEAFIITSFAFAMLHLSIPSLVTHLPLGLYFCWLRERSGSLWPGVLAHFCHNLGVCILEWTGVA